MAREDYWRIDDIPIDGHDGAETTRTRGESADPTVTLSITSDSDSDVWPGYVDRYRTLRDYQHHAGEFVTFQGIAGTVFFREQHTRPLSLLIALRPPADTDTGRGGWFLVSTCEDQTSLPSALCQIDFELTYLAALDDYADKQSVKDALEAQGP